LGDVKKSAAIMAHYAKKEIEDPSQLRDSEFLEDYLEKIRQMFSEIALNTSGVNGFYIRINPEYTNPSGGFYNLIGEDGDIRSMAVTDLSKYAPGDAKNVGWYYIPIQTGEATWLDPYTLPGYESTTLITHAVPLYVNSQLLGVVGIDMNFAYLVEKIDNITVYEKGGALLISADGNTIYNEFKGTESENPHTKAEAELLNGMRLELRAEYKDIQRDIHPMLSKIVLAFVVVLFFAILYTIFVTRQIIRPLKQLTSAAEELSSGILNNEITTIRVNTNDEVGTLSKVLQNTYEKIQEYTAYINTLAYKDSLTGIKNSTAYTEAIEELNKKINRDNPQFAVLIADINNLKETNDLYGHEVGNELIIHTAKILTSIFKASSVFRIGGDEFAVILKHTDLENYRALLAQFDNECSEDRITVLENEVSISVARGIAFYTPEIDTVFQDVFSKADHAMYLNKQEMKAAQVKG
ncbi:MAG: diguanylate cyclase, partial [Clostridia bacterium]|nr:diguanylate cyclase [Clostridia bacterium]